MDWLNFRHLYSFWMVSKIRNFTQAAQKMRVAQSAVSGQVAQLEEYLGEALFIRTTRSLELTKAGRQLQSYAQIIFETSRDINLVLKEKEQIMGTNHLSIGVVGGVSRNYLYRILEQFTENNISTEISVSTGSFVELTSQLKDLELDVILTLELPHRKDLDAFNYQKIGNSPMCLAGNKRLLNAVKGGKRRKPVDLYVFQHPYETDLIDNVVRPLLNVDLQTKLKTDDIPLLRFFANSNKGLVVIPKIGIYEDIETDKIAYWELKECAELNIYGVFMKKMVHEQLVRSLFADLEYK